MRNSALKEKWKMVTFAELQGRFPVRNVPPHGECIVIPGTEFDPDWEGPLYDEGCITIMTDLAGKAVALVKAKTAGSPSGQVKIQAEAKPRARSGWTEAEDQFLIKLWNQKLHAPQIATKIPERSEPAIRMRLKRLQENKVIQCRWTKRKGQSSHIHASVETKLPTRAPPEASTEVPTEVHTKIWLEIKFDNCQDEYGRIALKTIKLGELKLHVAEFLGHLEKLQQTIDVMVRDSKTEEAS